MRALQERKFSTTRIGMAIGALFALTSIVAAAIYQRETYENSIANQVRILIAICMAISAAAMNFRSEFAKSNYTIAVNLPIYVACVGLVAIVSGGNSIAPSTTPVIRSAFTMTIALLILQSFSCLHPRSYLTILVMFAGSIIIKVLTSREPVEISTILYFVIASISAYAFYTNSFNRDIKLEAKQSELEDSNRRLSSALDSAIEANEFKTHVLRAASHDIRQPLSAMAIRLSNHEEARALTKLETAAILRTLADVDETLDDIIYSADAQPSVSRPLEKVNISELIGDLIQSHQSTASARGIQISMMKAIDDKISGLTIRPLARRVLSNAIDNAIKHHHTESRHKSISILAKKLDKRILIEIRDDGPGISNRSTETTPGSGIHYGVRNMEDLSHKLVNHRLKIHTRTGIGTRIRFYIPLATKRPLQ